MNKKNTWASMAFFVQSLLAFQSHAQQVLMQGYYWDYPKTGQGYNWSDTLRLKAAELGKAGFTHIWFPPFAGNGNKSGGYDPKDLFIGNATTQTSLGTKQQIKNMVTAFRANNVKAVADMVYNHRDGGKAESNPAVGDYVLYYAGNNNGSCPGASYKSPYPSDRYRMVIPIGGATGLGAGDYYVSIASRSGGYIGKKYMFFATTTKNANGSIWDFVDGKNCTSNENAVVINTDIPATNGAQLVNLNQGYYNTIDNADDVDEFKITLTSDNYKAIGDTLFIQAMNICGDYTDHRPTKVWYSGTQSDIANPGTFNGISDTDNSHKLFFNSSYQLQFQTYTDFSKLSSGRGSLNWKAFRPNANEYGNSTAGGASTTCLGPIYSKQSMDYFYDYDHNETNTRDTLIAWTKWAWNTLGIRALRMDAVKHFESDFVGDMLNSMYKAGKTPDMVVGEWYGNEIDNQKNWIAAVNNRMTAGAKAAISPKVFDFALREALKNACDNAADPRHVYFDGLHENGLSGFNIVTFLNNHDMRSSDSTHGDALVWHDPMLGYAYLLTNNQMGVPTIFYPDYYGYPAHNTIYGTDNYSFSYHPTRLQPMKNEINQLMKVQKNFINGSKSVDYLNHYGGLLNQAPSPNDWQSGQYYKTLLYQLNATGSAGGKEVIVAINFSKDTLKVYHSVAVRNGIKQGTVFTDILQKSPLPSSKIDNQSRIYIQLLPRSYAIFVQGAPTDFNFTKLAKKLPAKAIKPHL